MKKIVKIAFNAVNAKIITEHNEVDDILLDLLSYVVSGFEFTYSYKSGSWDGKSSFYSYKNKTFPAGFVYSIQSELSARGYYVVLIKKPLPEPLGDKKKKIDSFPEDKRYAYQERTIENLLSYGRMIARVATGGGKSRICRMAVARIKRPTLFITTRGVLMYQMGEAFKENGYKVGYIGDGNLAYNHQVTCATIQTLTSRLKEPELEKEYIALKNSAILKGKNTTKEKLLEEAKNIFNQKRIKRIQTIKFLEKIEFVVGEEAHEAGGNSYYEILKYCKNAYYRLGLTATPFMRDSTEDNMRLMAAFGPIGMEVSEKELIDSGILAKPYFWFKVCAPHKNLRKTSPWQRAYQLGYIENVHLNEEIVNDALKAKAHGLSVMTLIQRKDHGKKLFELMQSSGLKALYIKGENDQNERRKALNMLARGEIDVLIGTTILDVGVDVPSVGMIQLAGGGKAEVGMRQRIGRGLRAKKTGPNVAFIIDYSVDLNTTLLNHSAQRKQIVETTPGFNENIVKELDWSIFNPIK